jgi:hypothetical protein
MQVETEQIKELALSLLRDQAISVAAIGPGQVLQEVQKQYQDLWR